MPRSFPLHNRKRSADNDSSSTISTASPFKTRFYSFMNKRKNVTSRKKVSFYPQVKVYTVERYAEELFSQLWYSRKDVHAIAVDNHSTLQQYHEKKFKESSSNTLLGLEVYLKREQMKKKRQCVCKAVLQAQIRFRRTGASNMPEKIASVYKDSMDLFHYF